MNTFEIVLLSFIEGLTEFLPISSTGHLILTSAALGIAEGQFVKSFNIIIQFGAILSVLVLYWRNFLPNLDFYKKLFIAFLPAAVIGLLLKNKIDDLLDNVTVVAWALVLGGVVLILSDKFFKTSGKKSLKDFKLGDYFKLGLLQCFAFIPGVSRSGATIVGGMGLGLSKKEAAEFSFFLAVPTLAGASLVKTLKILPTIESHQIASLIAGMILSFVFALAAIKFFIKIVSNYGFLHFGIYRIILGGIILGAIYGGWIS